MKSRHIFAVAIAVLSLVGVAQSSAQEPVPVTAEGGFFVVNGLAPGDFLNIRATASATGMVIGRLPNGSKLKNLGCSEIGGARWCKVEDVQSAQVAGWAAGRYLIDFGETEGATEETAEPAFDATAMIPCARYFGQPMTQCQAGVKRGKNGKAEIVVNWPDGGERIVRFEKGQPESSDAEDDIRFTRESDLHMIRIGEGERLEVPNAFAFGG